jgi:hypothetical protein
VTIQLVGNLLDNATGKFVATYTLRNSPVVYYNQSTSGHGFSDAGILRNFNLTFKVALNSADQYLFYTFVTTRVSTGCGGNFCPISRQLPGIANLDLGSPGKGAWLLSMKVV